MKIFSKQNVFEAALDRIRFIFDEFENVVVGFSGGKDSTVTLEMCMIVAKEKHRIPLRVMWIDQEAEWQSTVNYCESVMTRSDVLPMWFQMPILMTNNASTFSRFSACWDENAENDWIHSKHPISIKQNIYSKNRFHDLFKAIFSVEFNNKKSCYISGVRTEESPSRFMGLTSFATYKWATWGAVLDKKNEHYTFYPLYDWSYHDVWAAIHKNQWTYNSVYNDFYRLGVNIREMRVSNLHHETAIHHLSQVHEIEPETWAKITKRIGGANTIAHLNKNSFQCPDELPPMFNSWKEYAMHLAKNLIPDEKNRNEMFFRIENMKGVKNIDGVYALGNKHVHKDFYRAIINTILSNDWDLTKLTNWEDSPNVSHFRKYIKTGVITEKDKKNKYVTG